MRHHLLCLEAVGIADLMICQHCQMRRICSAIAFQANIIHIASADVHEDSRQEEHADPLKDPLHPFNTFVAFHALTNTL